MPLPLKWGEVLERPEWDDLNMQEQVKIRQLWHDNTFAPEARKRGIPEEEIQGNREYQILNFDNGTGYISSFGKSALQGVGSLFTSAVQGTGALTGIDTLEEAGASGTKLLQNELVTNPQHEYTNIAGQAIGNVAGFIGTMGAAGLAAKGLAGAGAVGAAQQGAAMGTAFLAGAGEGASRADALGMSPDEKLQRVVAGGVIEAGTEMLGLGTEMAILRGARRPGFIRSILTEGGEEAVAETGGNIADRTLAPEGAKVPEVFENVGKATFGGMVGGTVFGGLNALTAPAIPSPAQTAAQTAQQSGMPEVAKVLEAVQQQAAAQQATLPGSTLTEDEFNRLSPDRPLTPEEAEAGELAIDRRAAELSADLSPDRLRAAFDNLSPASPEITVPANSTQTANEEDQRQREAQLLSEGVAPSEATAPASPAVAQQPETPRPTRHRVFEGGSPIRVSGEDVLQAPDETMAYRVTGQEQIDDILQSGEVRAREGKMKGGRSGETQWSRGNERLGYKAAGNEGRYVIETSAEGLNDRQGGLPVSAVNRVWKAQDGQWVDVTDQIVPKTGTTNDPQTPQSLEVETRTEIGTNFADLEAEVSRRLGPDFIAQARTQEPSKAMSALRAAFPDVSEENLQSFAEEVVNRAAIDVPANPQIVVRRSGQEIQNVADHQQGFGITQPGMAYRGMDLQEFNETLGKGQRVESRGDFRFAVEGTNFAKDFETAEDYANFGRTDPRKTGQPTYIVEAPAEGMKANRRGELESFEPVAPTRVWKITDQNGDLVAEDITATLVNRPVSTSDIAAGEPVFYHGSSTKGMKEFSGPSWIARDRSAASEYAESFPDGKRTFGQVYEVAPELGNTLELWKFKDWVDVIETLERKGTDTAKIKEKLIKYSRDKTWEDFVSRVLRVRQEAVDEGFNYFGWDIDGGDLVSAFGPGSKNFGRGSNKKDLVEALFDAGFDSVGQLEGDYDPEKGATYIVKDPKRLKIKLPVSTSDIAAGEFTPPAAERRFPQMDLDAARQRLQQGAETRTPENAAYFDVLRSQTPEDAREILYQTLEDAGGNAAQRKEGAQKLLADLTGKPAKKSTPVEKTLDDIISHLFREQGPQFSPQSVNPPQTPTGVVPADTVQSSLTNFRKRIGAPLSQVTILSKSEAAEQYPDVAADPRFQNAEGFYINGQVVIMPDGIGLRAGETPESAATRVILHETAGHLGLRDALGKWSGEVENALKELQKSVPSLQGRSIAEVEEYFARAIENGGVPKTGILKKVWDAIVNAVRKIFGMEKIPNEEAVIRELLGRSLESLRGGVAAGQSQTAFSGQSTSLITPQQDAAYMQAVESGDMETAQRMVDEAAKAAGYTTGPLWHGPRSKEWFNTFDGKWHFLSDDKRVADKFADEQAYMLTIDGEQFPISKHEADMLRPEPVEDADWATGWNWLDPENGYDSNSRSMLRALGYNETASSAILEKTETPAKAFFVKPGVTKSRDYAGKMWDSGKNSIERNLSDDIDTFVAKNIQEGGMTGNDSEIEEENFPVATTYAVKNPNQIKSADPVTRDAAGNVIPLSQRFNPNSNDIRFSERVRSRGVPQHVDQEWLPVSQVSVEQNYDQANELLDQLSADPFTGSREAISIVRSHLAGSPDNSTELGRQLQVNPQLPLATLHAVALRMGDAAEIAAPGGKISNPWQWTEARTLTTQAMQLYQQQGQNHAQNLSFMRWHLAGTKGVPSFADYGPLLSIWGIQLENAKDRVTSRTGPGGIAAITGAGNTGTAVAQTGAAAAVENVGEEEDIKAIKKSLKTNNPTKAVKNRSQRIIDSLVPLPPKTKAEVLRIIEEQERQPTDDFVNRLTAIGVDPAAAMLLENQLRDLRIGARQADALAGYPRLKRLIEKMHTKPGGAPRWADIFRGIHGSSRDVERQLIIELQKNEAFASLPRDERLAVAEDLRNLFNELRRKEAEKAIKALNNRGKTEEDRKKVDSAIPALMQLLELGGVLTEDSVAKAIGEKFGIRTMTPAEEAHALSMWKEIRGLKGVVRRRKVREMIDYIARTAHFTTAEIVHDWTMRSILANGSTLMSILNGGLAEAMSMAFTVPVGRSIALMRHAMRMTGKDNAAAAAAWKAAARVVAQMPRNLIHLLNGFAAGAYVMGTGDTSILTNYTDSAQSLLQEGTTPGARNRNQDIHFLDAYWRNMRKNTKWLSSGFAKKAGATWMDLAGRMIQSADVVARIIVQEIALDTQLAQQDPDLLQAIRNPSKADRETAYRKAIADIYGSGSVPSRFIAMNNPAVKARMTEILGYDAAGTDERRTGLERSYVLAEDIAKAANLQKNPQGIARYIYRGGVSLGGIAENALTDLANQIKAKGETAPPVLQNLLNFLAFVSHYTGKSASLIFGTKFMRAVVGLGTQAVRFVPGSAALRSLTQKAWPATFDGRNELLDGHWYMLNMVGLSIGYALAKYADKDDDEEGLHIEGPWNWFNFDQQKERKAAGLSPLSVWRRNADGSIDSWGYSQMPFRVLLAAVGSQKDNRLGEPAKYDKGWFDRNIPSLSVASLAAVKDVAALDTFQRLISASPFSTPEERELGIVTRLGQSAMQTVTGVFPRFIKDIDQGLDPNRYTERSLWGNFVRGVPFARGAANEGRPDVTILGRPVDVSSAPWRRFYKPFVPRDESEKVLFDLIAKGVKIPSWSDVSKGAYMVLDEDNVPQKVPDDLAYQISVEQGQALADILTNYDLSGDPETVSRQLSDITENAWRNVRRQHRVIHGRQ